MRNKDKLLLTQPGTDTTSYHTLQELQKFPNVSDNIKDFCTSFIVAFMRKFSYFYVNKDI